MTNPMRNIQHAITSGQAGPEDYAALPLPDAMRAVTTHRDEIDMFEGLESWDKDPRQSLHVDEVALPQVGPNEALVAVMASSINFNTVWSAIFEPIPTFQFLKRAAKRSPQIIGSHFANYREAWEANRLVVKRAIHPLLSETYPLDRTGEAALQVHHNKQIGKMGVLCLAPQDGLGVSDEEGRARHIGQINLYRNAVKGEFRLVKTEP